MIHHLCDMIGDAGTQAMTAVGYRRAVPMPFMGGLLDRLRDAWAVLKGFDNKGRGVAAVRWPEAGELEVATRVGEKVALSLGSYGQGTKAAPLAYQSGNAVHEGPSSAPAAPDTAGLVERAENLARLHDDEARMFRIVSHVGAQAESERRAKIIRDLLAALKAAPVSVEVVTLAKELLALAEKATPGPWVADEFCMERDRCVRIGTTDGTPTYYHRSASICEAWTNHDEGELPKGEPRIGIIDAERNAAFMARCREAVPIICRALAATEKGAKQ